MRHHIVCDPLRLRARSVLNAAARALRNRPDSIKDMQRNWIGRSEGAQFAFDVVGSGEKIEVYTTRPDTIFGATYVVIAPEHPLVLAVCTAEQRSAVAAYIDTASRKSDLERTELAKEKTGVWTGASVLNPATGKAIPVWVAGAHTVARVSASFEARARAASLVGVCVRARGHV